MSTISVIKAELDDNVSLYGSMTDQEVADELNLVDKQRNRTSMSRAEIYENIDSAALAGLTSLQLDQLNLALSDNVDPFGNAAQVFVDIFGNPSDTITALIAARVETVSQAEILGIGGIELNSLVGWVTEARAI